MMGLTEGEVPSRSKKFIKCLDILLGTWYNSKA